MKVRLTRKLAEEIDGIDLSGRGVGETLDLPQPEARLLMAEEWAVPERRAASRPVESGRRAEDEGAGTRPGHD